MRRFVLQHDGYLELQFDMPRTQKIEEASCIHKPYYGGKNLRMNLYCVNGNKTSHLIGQEWQYNVTDRRRNILIIRVRNNSPNILSMMESLLQKHVDVTLQTPILEALDSNFGWNICYLD